MKSKKIIAMIVAFAAFMAVATSGLAAVSTTTTYHTGTTKVTVDVDITGAEEGSEVTYLVTNSAGQIVYIDQDTAGTNGAVNFDYKIEKDDISNLVTNVKLGTNGNVPASTFAASGTAIELNNLLVTENNSTVTLYSDINTQNPLGENVVVGDGDKIYAKVVVDEGYQIDEITIGGEPVDKTLSVHEIEGNKAIVVTTSEKEVTPSVSVETVTGTTDFGSEGDNEGADAETYKNTTKVVYLKVTGKPNAVGVKVGEVKYPALSAWNGTNASYDYVEGQIYAVRIISDEDVTVVEYCE